MARCLFFAHIPAAELRMNQAVKEAPGGIPTNGQTSLSSRVLTEMP